MPRAVRSSALAYIVICLIVPGPHTTRAMARYIFLTILMSMY